MADTNERVMDMVREELGKNPNASATELQDKAQKIDASMGELTTRQFHARYPLQVKRAKAVKKSRRKGGRKKAAAKKAAAATGAAPKKRSARKKTARKSARKSAAKRAAKSTGGSRRGGRSAKGPEGVKSVLVDFAGKIAGADTATVVKVMGDLDGWVDRVLKAAG